MQPQPGTFSERLGQSLAESEKRDWQLWILALAMVVIMTIGFVSVLLPAILLGQRSIHVQADLSVPAVLGLLVLVLLLVAHLIREHLRVRSQRYQSVMDGVKYEIGHAGLLTDPLTNVFNRSAIEAIFDKEIERLRRKKTTLVFCYIDINDFKEVNTRFGHLTGDLVLAEVGGLLKKCTRGSDYAIRIGGDEFLIVLVDTNMAGSKIVKGRINQAVIAWNDQPSIPKVNLSLSIGLKELDGSQTFDEALAEADANMYVEKKSHHS